VALCLLSYSLYLTLDGYWIPELDVDSEGSVAAWLSSVALFSCALVLVGIARRQDTGRRAPWAALAAVFGYFSLDEMSSLHEKVSDPLREALSSSGPLLHPWVIPAAVACMLGTIAFWPLLRTLNRETSGLFTAGGFVYFGGAIGFEVLSGIIAGPPGVPDSRYAAVATVEELLEMLGITVFLAALADYDRSSPTRPSSARYAAEMTGGADQKRGS